MSVSQQGVIFKTYIDLIDRAKDIIRTYNPIKVTLDSHAEEYFARFSNTEGKCTLDKSTQVFLKQVLYGVVRYEQFNKILTDGLFRAYKSSTNRKDALLYHIIAYLIIFRFDDLPKNELSCFLLSQDAYKMNSLLNFLFNIEEVRENIFEEWCTVFDEDFIEETVLDGLERKREELESTLTKIAEKALGKAEASKHSTFLKGTSTTATTFEVEKQQKKTTTPQPFNLSKPKPRAIPEPIKIAKKVKANPVPDSIYKTNLKELEEGKKKKREKRMKDRLKELEEIVAPFDLETDARPTNIEKLQEENEKNIKKTLQFNKKHAAEVPDYGDVDIKLNAAAIMKEAQAIQQKREEEEKYLKEVEINLRDSGEWRQWKEEQKRLDKEKELKEQIQRKIEMELAHEAAQKAIENQILEKKKNVEEMKIQKVKQNKIRKKKKEEIIKRNTEIKTQVYEARGNIKVAQKEIITKNVKAAEEQKEKLQLEIEYKKIEEKRQQKIRDELIRKIRELDRKVITNTNSFDPEDKISHGLLEEMNLVELKEQLSQKKKEFKIQEENKRKEILAEKEQKNNKLRSMMDIILEARSERIQKNTKERREKKNKAEARKEREAAISKTQVIEITKKIEDKKARMKEEDEELQKLAKEIRLKKQYMNANQDKVEEQAWKNLESGQEREIKHRQNYKMEEQYKTAKIKLQERELMAEGFKNDFKTTLDRQREYNIRVDEEERDNELLMRQDRLTKKEQVTELRTFKAKHRDNLEESRPFDFKVSTK